MTYCVLVNEGAGSVDDGDESGEADRIVAAFRAAGSDAEVRRIAPDDLRATMEEIWGGTERPEAIVVAGGDGTVNAAAGVAAGTDIVIGVLPMGTFNHFAKDLGMEVELDGAVADLVEGAVRHVDVAEVNGRIFVNNSAIGVYPAMVAARERLTEKRRWGKVRAVPLAVVRVLRSFPTHRLELRGNDGYHRSRVRTPFVFIGNGPYESESGRVGQRATLDDGHLGVYIARVTSRLGLVWTMIRTMLSGSHAAREMDRAELTEVEIHSGVGHLRVALDGEICWLETPLRYRSRPGALRVMAPVPPPADPPVRDPAVVVEER